MSHVKLVAIFAVLIALALLISGLTIRNAGSSPWFAYRQLSSETFFMDTNTTAYQNIDLPSQGSYRIVVNTPSNYTILSASVPEDSFLKWQKGQFNVSWDGNLYDGNMYGLSGNSKSYFAGTIEGHSLLNQTLLFWNPDLYSKQVNLIVYSETFKADQADLNNSNMLLASGTVLIASVAAFFVIKNRHSIKVTRKKGLALLVSLLMLAGGLFLADTYNKPVEAQNLIDQGTVNVPANGYYPLGYIVSQDGNYMVQFNVDRGAIQAFHSSDGSVIGYWGNGTAYDIRSQYYPSFNGSSGITGSYYLIENPYKTYYILSNTDNYSKNVTYEITYNWTYNNYVAMMAGIAITIFGCITFVLTLLKGKLKNFNKALDNQE
ncbi:MAG: hypothetical protein ACQCN5_04800 [Candidatus Bathyarchaeia archaeon]